MKKYATPTLGFALDILTTPSQDTSLANSASQGDPLGDEPAFTHALTEELLVCLADDADRPARLMEAMRYAVMGPGKRLRPRLVAYAAQACGAKIQDALPAAAAVEFIHAYSLIHDDLPAMDDDDLRRGRPTVHRQFDEALAILAGDALQALAFETLATRLADPRVAARACAELAAAAGPGGLVGGQVDDLAGAEAAPPETEARLLHLRRIHARKTSALITVSLRLGAIIAHADKPTIDRLTRYGQAIGMAFQVTDDLLDAQGDQAAVGKRVGKDLDRGKLTYPSLLGVEASQTHAAQLIATALDSLDTLAGCAEPLRSLARQILGRDR
ncbi:polyprenyl synthetase family protein [Botrimarina hoheduenensis]|uniref:Farnesyl diphosphate synthase n=1 Tax=Botrimarina hoheduenensis TaxID=2528000 RepID=A0A5C5VUK1_9BACT|nr:farnesyl diphosphate synthase [Botrimarina hoheduenensis]TWT41595.1 Farnesyl diphosphate synthase [Botrimarina hoheduenensis]